MKQAVIMPYRKVGMQLGVTPDAVFVFEADNPLWAKELQEDWESIRDEMIATIEKYKKGQIGRRASGICKSDSTGCRRPHGYLGIRSDGVILTKKFFEIVSKHYTITK
jgi:aspartyl/asparaginyl beta-hydroxylase (cupin superfamily)